MIVSTTDPMAQEFTDESGVDPALEAADAPPGSREDTLPDSENASNDARESAAAGNGDENSAADSEGENGNSEKADLTFADLGLSDHLLQAVTQAGYTTPTPIQAQAIPVALQGRDVLGLAQTGTGKTASFTLPMIDLLAQGRVRARMPRSLILAPTRELAAQVSESFEKYGKNNKLSMALLIGGVSFADQEQKLDRGVDVLIATPGRLLDHAERGKVLLSGVQVLVIDEADRMLDMGFIPDIERIIKLTPFTRQTLFFSATMPKEIEDLTQRFLQNPVRVEVAKRSSTAETVEQALCTVRSEDKREALRQLIRNNPVKNAIIFCNRKRDVSVVFRSLTKHGFNVAALHGDLDQRVRLQVLDQFRKGNIQLLVASDVAARGLDIPEVSHVFNFDVPFNSEDYVHRIGRTGRAGREGHAFMIATASEGKLVAAIEKLIAKPIPRFEMDGLAPSTDDDVEGGEARGRGRKRRRGGSGREREERRSEARSDNRPNRDNSQDRSSSDGGSSRNGDRNKQNRRGRRYRDQEDDTPVVGLGDHVPAFLLRPVRLPSPTTRAASQEEAVAEPATSDGEGSDILSEGNAALA